LYGHDKNFSFAIQQDTANKYNQNLVGESRNYWGLLIFSSLMENTLKYILFVSN